MTMYQKTITEVFEKACDRYHHRTAFTCLRHSITYGEVDDLSRDLAAYLQNHTNLQPGDRVAIQLPNILQYPVILFAAIRAGYIVVNINPLYTPREIEHQLNDSGAKVLFVFANVAHAAATIIDGTMVEEVIVTDIADFHPKVKRLFINNLVRHVKHMVPAYHFANAKGLRDVIEVGHDQQFSAPDIDYENTAVLQYTGGTTGVAKGAMLSHRNLVTNMMQVNEHMQGGFRECEDVLIAPLPLYHIYAFTMHCMCSFNLGNQSVLIPNPRDIPAFVRELRSAPFNIFIGLNTLFNALCHNEDFKQLDFSELRLTTSGGMALTHTTAQLWRDTTGCDICEGYGLTETSPVVTINPYAAIRMGTIGIPVPGTEVKVIDAQGQCLPAGEVGELCVRGPQVMQGYWQRPKDTENSIDAEGWFRTGDIASIDDDGYLRIVDRKKDMIIVSGFNVYPNEVEDVVAAIPGVLECAVVGVEDSLTGEAVKLFVVADPSSTATVTATSIKNHCCEHLTGYKKPKYIIFKESLPKSTVGKVLRKELRDESQ